MRLDEFPVFSVSEINAYVKGMFARDELLNGIRLRGEISNFKHHSSGHMYFSLKDAGARINCVLFRQHSFGLRVPLRDGLSIVAQGYVSLYERDGQYQFYVESVQTDGVGTLYALYEQTKRRLESQGYFDPAHKKPLPADPSVIGVVTSATGAVIRDIVRVTRRRNPAVHILLCPASVQGEGAAEEIAAAIARLSREKVDVILCGRGGGSLEDLWAFNEEIVAQAIYDCPVPIISCVGHETDFTIADFVADVRAATPSQAAELAVPDTSAYRQRLDMGVARLQSRARQALDLRQEQLNYMQRKLQPQRGLLALDAAQKVLDSRLDMLQKGASLKQYLALEKLRMLFARLDALDPERALKRGYAMAKNDRGWVVRADGLQPGDRLALRFYDGEADVSVDTVRRREETKA